MIRTRDFLVFSGTLVFLFALITATVVTNSLSGANGQMASVGTFTTPSSIEGAIAPTNDDNQENNIARLKTKIAAGEGDVTAGEPVFTSVDDIVIDDTAVITDQTPPQSVVIGQTTDGQPLMSDDLWRFVGYSQFEQIGTASNGVPIFGSRADSLPLDTCGGGDDGSGYRLYLRSSENFDSGCFGL